MWSIRLVLILVFAPMFYSHEHFQSNIPNGDRIPNPCNASEVWGDVGNLTSEMFGELNSFVLNFKNHGYIWTREFCELDSDGDGRTNGEELGDPNCLWEMGFEPQSNMSISHPGVCEPIDSAQCKEQNKVLGKLCSKSDVFCPALKEKGVKSFVLKIPKGISVPMEEASLFCLNFDIANYGIEPNKSYHIVGSEPVVDNAEVIHHLLYYKTPELDGEHTGIFQCSLAVRPVIGGWTKGSRGECYHEKIGFKIGRGGFMKLTIRFHWQNTKRKSGLKDSSGIRIFYTENLRENDAKFVAIGRTGFSIPAGRKNYVVTGTCTKECSENKILSTIYVVHVLNHMHTLGVFSKTELYRKGKRLQVFANESYSFGQQNSIRFNRPIEVRRGDELVLSCTYDSSTKEAGVDYGLSSMSEMCYAYLTIYPAEHFMGNQCIEPCIS